MSGVELVLGCCRGELGCSGEFGLQLLLKRWGELLLCEDVFVADHPSWKERRRGWQWISVMADGGHRWQRSKWDGKGSK